MIDEKLFDAMSVLAGALTIGTRKAVLRDIEGWNGPEIEAARQAFYKRLRLHYPPVDQSIHPTAAATDAQQLLAALAEYCRVNDDQNLDHFLAGYVGADWQSKTVA